MEESPSKARAINKAQQTCSTNITNILQTLKNDGLHTIPDIVIREWRSPLPASIQDLVQRIAFLYTLLENWKVSIATTYNPLMTAMGYEYMGHDYGWSEPHLRRELPTGSDSPWSSTYSSHHNIHKDAVKAKATYDLYKLLLCHTASLHHTTKEFRRSMSLFSGPTTQWIIPCNIAQPPHDKPPPVLNYLAPPGTECLHCHMKHHEEHRCYTKDPRNMYRYPPNAGWPNGKIPSWYLRMYNGPDKSVHTVMGGNSHLPPGPWIPVNRTSPTTQTTASPMDSPINDHPPPPYPHPLSTTLSGLRSCASTSLNDQHNDMFLHELLYSGTLQ
jgi:hypothetical protein